MDKEFYDLVHEAYMSGKDPDAVSEDAYEMCKDRGFYPDEIKLRDVYPNKDN
ncbi:MAG: hypothetical protein M0R03_19545 [Novosphingobium sp.]|nr:hypothetical protein [Novosphingobium sp.]